MARARHRPLRLGRTQSEGEPHGLAHGPGELVLQGAGENLFDGELNALAPGDAAGRIEGECEGLRGGAEGRRRAGDGAWRRAWREGGGPGPQPGRRPPSARLCRCLT